MAQKKVPYRRRRLGKRLRRMREAAGFTIKDAAIRLEKARTSLVRIEKGEYLTDVHLVKSMMDLYDHWDENLLDLTRDALKPSWVAAYGIKDFGYIDVETEASRVRNYAGMHLPGLLHADPYIRALFEQTHRGRSLEELASAFKVRSIRRERLRAEEAPLEFVAIIDEAALRREIGGPEVMRAQLQHMIAMAALPTVTLQVLEMRGCPTAALNGAFTLLDFPDPDEPDLLYHEYVTGALHIDDREEVREAKLVFDALRSVALNPADSVALIEQLI